MNRFVLCMTAFVMLGAGIPGIAAEPASNTSPASAATGDAGKASSAAAKPTSGDATPSSTTSPAGAAQPTASNKDSPRPAFQIETALPDPTRIGESFRQALEQRMPSQASKAGGGGNSLLSQFVMPNISMVAKVCNRHKGMMRAMLRVADKVELVGPGDELTFVEKNMLTTIKVMEIQPDFVRIRVSNSAVNQEMILH